MSKTIKIHDIVIDPAIQIRVRLNPDAVEHYADIFDSLPPIKIYNVNGKLLLVDGFTRLAAAGKLHRNVMRADVKTGTYKEALVEAFLANCRHGQPLTRDERHAGVLRLSDQGWSRDRISKTLGIGVATVADHINARDVKTYIGDPTMLLTQATEIGRAPKKHWKQLAQAAHRRDWSRDEIRLAVKNLNDERVPDAHKRLLVEGKANPLAFSDNGEPGIRIESVAKQVKRATEDSGALAWNRAVIALDLLKRHKPDKVAGQLQARDLKLVDEYVDEAIDYLKALQRASKEARRLRVVA